MLRVITLLKVSEFSELWYLKGDFKIMSIFNVINGTFWKQFMEEPMGS